MSNWRVSKAVFAHWRVCRPILAVLFGALIGSAHGADAVKELRRALRQPAVDVKGRQTEIQSCVARICTTNDLAEALMLCEWRDCDVDDGVAAVDRAARVSLQAAFEKQVRAAFQAADPQRIVAVIDVIASLGKAEADDANSRGVARRFTSDLALLSQLPDWGVREAAVRALGRMQPDVPIAMAALDVLLRSHDRRDRLAAARAVQELISSMRDRTAKVASAHGLHTSADDVAEFCRHVLPLAGQGLADEQVEVRLTCAKAATETAAMLDKAFAGDSRAESPAETQTSRASTRQAALQAMRDHVGRISTCLKDTNRDVRLQTCRALEAIAVLRARVHSTAAQLAVDGADLLGEGFAAAMPLLVDSLLANDPALRLAVLAVLEALGPLAEPAGKNVAANCCHSDRFVRWAAARTLGRMAPAAGSDGVPALIALLTDPEFDVRLAATIALGHYGLAARIAAPLLLQLLERKEAVDVKLAAMRSLQSIGVEDIAKLIAVLATALGDRDSRLRSHAAEYLGRLGPAARPAISFLQKARSDADPAVRQAADRALLQILDP